VNCGTEFCASQRIDLLGSFEDIVMPTYTAISFAPVQGFIEKSRKLRDLFGASLILSYLSFKLIEAAQQDLGEDCVISPGLVSVQEGMPNRILIKGYWNRDRARNKLVNEWQMLLQICREWVENNIGIPQAEYCWAQAEDQKGKQKGEWERWGSHSWEIFWGTGSSLESAMEDLETRKLKRDWVGINWMGESSSLTGTDAIAWQRLGAEYSQPGQCQPGQSLTQAEKNAQRLFYLRLAWVLDNPDRNIRQPFPSLAQLEEIERTQPDNFGKYIAPNERLSIPELVKRLVTYDKLADVIGIEKLKKTREEPEFKDIVREAGYWTGWFLGDGDRIGQKLKLIAERNSANESQQEQDLKQFTQLMRNWGQKFKADAHLFPQGKGRVIYAGGDDFLGVLYSKEKPGILPSEQKAEEVKPWEAWTWLLHLEEKWQDLKADLQQGLNLDLTYSVGFVWAGHAVPQRDVLQHCREAEKRAKSLGRDRLTIRVVFNSGQFVQWTCPWKYLNILSQYCDREDQTGETANWNHIYNDWAQLKVRHAVRLQEMEGIPINKQIALSIFDLYFNNAGTRFWQERLWDDIANDNSDQAIVNWIDDLIQVGWQLCRNSNS
jgi:CRISPR-associated protein Cmr2